MNKALKVLWVTGPLAVIVQALYWTGYLRPIVRWALGK